MGNFYFAPPKFERADPFRGMERALTLRQLADAQEYRRAQMRHMQLQEQEAADKRERAMALRGLFAAGTMPAREQILAADPVGGLAFIKELDAQKKERRLAESAGAEVQAKRQALTQGQKEQAFNELGAVRQVADPETRDRMFMEWQAKYQGLGNIVHGVGYPIDEKGFAFAGMQAMGPDKWRAYLAALAEDKRKAELAPLELAKTRAETARVQQEVTGQALPSPAPLPALFEQWVPGYLESNRMADTAQNRTKAVEEYHKLLGISQGMSPEALEQRLGLFRQETALKAEADKNKPQSAEASKVTSIAETLIPELDQLKKAIADGGKPAILAILTGSDPELRKLATNAADKVGRLRSGGAVNPSEEARFMGAIAAMMDLAPWVAGTMPSQNAIDRYTTEAQVVLRGIKPDANTTPPAGGKSGGTNQPVIRWGKDANGNPVRLP